MTLSSIGVRKGEDLSLVFIKVVPDQQFSVSGRRHSTYLLHPSLIHLQRLLPYFIGIHQSCALFNDSVVSLTHGAVTQPTVGSINNSSPILTMTLKDHATLWDAIEEQRPKCGVDEKSAVLSVFISTLIATQVRC